MINEPSADLIVRINNANKAKIPSITLGTSNLVTAILTVLKAEGYITDFKAIVKNKKSTTIVELKYKNLVPTINGIKQISKPGLRVYQESKKLPRVLHGLGTAIISTSNVVMTDKQARKANIGGEVLMYVC